MLFTGRSEDGNRMEVMELNNHPYFVGVQYHPESILSEYGHQLLKNFLCIVIV